MIFAKYDNPKLQFYLGDVRDQPSVDHAMTGVDFVFHAADQTGPSCEFHPTQAVLTNIIGTQKIHQLFLPLVKKVVCLSTDNTFIPLMQWEFQKR